MHSFFAISVLLLVHSSANACTCAQRSVERVGLMSKNIIKVRVVQNSFSDHINNILGKIKSIYSNDDSDAVSDAFIDQRSSTSNGSTAPDVYKVEIVERLKGDFQGNQIFVSNTSNCAAKSVPYWTEFYIYFNQKPYASMCNTFHDEIGNANQKLFSDRLRSYIRSPKFDIQPINIKEWTVIEKKDSFTSYANFKSTANLENQNIIVWILDNFNANKMSETHHSVLSRKVKVEISCGKNLHRDQIEYYFSGSNASGDVVRIDNSGYDAIRNDDSGTWYPINSGFPIHTIAKHVCNSSISSKSKP